MAAPSTQAQATVWTASLTAGGNALTSGYCPDNPADPGVCRGADNTNVFGSVSQSSFSVAGQRYDVYALIHVNDLNQGVPLGIYLSLNPRLPPGTAGTLTVGGSSWSLASATIQVESNYVQYIWSVTGTPLSAGSSYAVSLSLSGIDVSDSLSGSDSVRRSVSRRAPTPWIDPRTCVDFSESIVIQAASSGVQCQSVTAAGIGSAAIVEAGYLDAVDIWAYVAPGTEVCFAQKGEIIMLDASTSPRQLLWLDNYASGDSNCAVIDRAGTIVLMTAEAAASVVASQTGAASRAVCSATVTAFLLNFRAAPDYGQVIGAIAKDTTVTAGERDGDWLRVTYAGSEGWIHSEYVTESGGCAGLTDAPAGSGAD